MCGVAATLDTLTILSDMANATPAGGRDTFCRRALGASDLRLLLLLLRRRQPASLCYPIQCLTSCPHTTNRHSTTRNRPLAFQSQRGCRWTIEKRLKL